MSVSTISSKGQLTLPASARRALGIHAGDRVTVHVRNGAIVIEPVADFLSMQGCLGPALPRDAELEAMQEEAVSRTRGRR